MSKTATDTCCAPDDMADLVEYLWGGNDTVWGKQRFEDGHPQPYKLKYIELVSTTHFAYKLAACISVLICACPFHVRTAQTQGQRTM